MQRTPWLGLAVTLVGLAAAGCGSGSAPQAASKSAQGPAQRWSSPPKMTLNSSKTYTATVTTSAGSFQIQLFAKQDPVAVNNFVFLADHGFYNGLQFFRVVPNFVIQAGDPLNNGQGGPGYTFADNTPPPFPYQPGIVAMARSSNPDSLGSQFFVCTGSQSISLNQTPQYAELGRVTQGLSIVEAIDKAPVEPNPAFAGENSKPIHPVVIKTINIVVH